MHMDVPTILICVTLVALVMAFWVCMMAIGKPLQDPLWPWAAALAAYAVSNVLFALREHLPPFATVGIGNTLYSVSLTLMLVAIRRFQGAPQVLWQNLLPVLLGLLLFGLLVDVFPLRATAVGVLFSVQLAFNLRALGDPAHPVRGRGRYILVVSFSLLMVVLLARALAIGSGWLVVDSVSSSNPYQAGLFVVALCAVMSIALGFVYMTMERAERQNYELAMRDMLTELENRRAINEELDRAVARARRHGELLGLLMIDIDHFKRVNDSFGHQAGDVVLRAVARTLRARLRTQDAMGRFGGEEFLAVLPETGLEGALTVAEALRAAVEATPIRWGAQEIAVTISVGVRAGPVTGADTSDTLVGAADAAMYRAKQAGRNRAAP
jgi:diguanylate cyclase (GGDEF)-like protein